MEDMVRNMRLRAIILTGGRSSRFGGRHKPAIEIDGATVLDRILTALAALDPEPEILIAGPTTGASVRAVNSVREEPPFAGPLAGIAAGVTTLPEDHEATVLILAGDLPFLTTEFLNLLVTTSEASGNVATSTDSTGHAQYLCAAWPESLLRGRLADLDGVANQPMRRLYEGVELLDVPVMDRLIADIDSPEDLNRLTR